MLLSKESDERFPSISCHAELIFFPGVIVIIMIFCGDLITGTTSSF